MWRLPPSIALSASWFVLVSTDIGLTDWAAQAPTTSYFGSVADFGLDIRGKIQTNRGYCSTLARLTGAWRGASASFTAFSPPTTLWRAGPLLRQAERQRRRGNGHLCR